MKHSIHDEDVLRPRIYSSSAQETLVFWALTAGFACLYFIFRTSCHTFDSIEYVNLARKLPYVNQFHPHHLLYHQILYALAQVEPMLGLADVASIQLYIIPSALFGGLSIGMFYHVGRRLGFSRLTAILTAIGTGVTFSVVSMSTDVEKYPIALFFILISLNFLILKKDLDTVSPLHSLLAGLALAIATLIHQTACLLLPVLMIFMWGHSSDSPKRPKNLVLFAGIYGFVTSSAYGGVGWFLGFKTIPELLNWMMSYAQTGYWGHGLSQPIHIWLEGNFGAMAGFWKTWVSPIRFFNAHQFHGLTACLYCAAWLLTLARLSIARIKDRKQKILPLVLLIWITGFSLFIIWWEPLNTKVSVLYVPAVWLLFGVSLTDRKLAGANRRAGDIVAVAVLISLVCCLAAITITRARQKHPESANHDLAVAKTIAANTNPSDMILLPHNMNVDRYLVYFFDRPHAMTIRSLVHSLSDPISLKNVLDTAFPEICQDDKEFYFTRKACFPAGQESSGRIRNNHIAEILGDMTDHADHLKQLPAGDELMRLRKDEFCVRYQ